MAPKSELYRQLSNSRKEDSLHVQRKYVPMDVLYNIITKESIKAELKRTSNSRIQWDFRGDRINNLADRVVSRNATKLFVILIYLNVPWDVKRFLDAGFTDKDLPLAKKEDDEERLQSALCAEKMFNPPNEWADQLVDNFTEKQWIVLAPVFGTSGVHRTLHHLCPLPFLKMTSTDVHSSHSAVYKAEVHPSHQNGFKVSATVAFLTAYNTNCGRLSHPVFRLR